ncbi:MAG: DUF4166 domain-containing protein [Pseudomonadota bacterium]
MARRFPELETDPRPGPPPQPDFRRLLGAAWPGLPTAVRRRFGPHAPGETTLYEGRMRVEANLAGRLIAQVCRLIGTPLAPWTGADVPVTVAVSLDGGGGLVWARAYRFAGRPPCLVSSTKLADDRLGLLEVVRGGLGMALDIEAADGALHFRSRRYFLRLGGRRWPIPHLLTPGRAHVIHRDQGAGVFRFTLTFDHPWLGRTFRQDGLFRDPG